MGVLTTVLQFPYEFFEYPARLLLIIPFVLILWWLLRKQFFSMREDAESRRRKLLVRRVMLFSRTAIVLLLLIALARPFIVHEKMFDGDPVIKVLVDNSSSMGVFDFNSQALIAELKKKLNVELRSFGGKDDSPVGDALLANMEPDASVLLITDGRATRGTSLAGAVLLASKLNATVNAVRLAPIRQDVGVELFGPSKTLEGSDTVFTVVLKKTNPSALVHVRVLLDGQEVFSEESAVQSFPITRQFGAGYHRFEASVSAVGADDLFFQNNVFYKTVKVVPKPRIFFMYSNAGNGGNAGNVGNVNSPLIQLYKQVYNVDVGSSMPKDISQYYAVVLNDVSSDRAGASLDALTEFVVDGNGLVVVGGKNSYDRGEYKGSLFEKILPVFVSSAEKKEGNVNIAVVADVSGSMGAAVGLGKAVELGKSLIVSVIRDLASYNRVGIVAFNTEAYTVAPLRPLVEQKDIEERIARLQEGGGTWIHVGLARAIIMLGQASGSKNIVMLTDGQSQTDDVDLSAAQEAANQGIKIYPIGVGDVNEDHLMAIAEITGGTYFHAIEAKKIKILFGDLEEEKKKAEKSLVVMDQSHFVTSGLELKAKVYGFNQVIPKRAARLLVTSDGGEPVLAVWRLGLGRVASYATDDGSSWSGQLLAEPDSKLPVKTLHWVVGAPDRKAKDFIEVADARVTEPTTMLVRSSDGYPSASGFTFYKQDKDLYTATVVPNVVGFQGLLSGEFSVNYAREYDDLGQGVELENLVRATGGKMFDPADAQGIADFTLARLKRTITTKDTLQTPFVIAALILFLLEVLVRRVLRRE